MNSYMRYRPSQVAWRNNSLSVLQYEQKCPRNRALKIRILGENEINSKLEHRKAHNSILSGRFGDLYVWETGRLLSYPGQLACMHSFEQIEISLKKSTLCTATPTSKQKINWFEGRGWLCFNTLYSTAFAPTRKPYRKGGLFTHENGDFAFIFGAISATAPISKVESHISYRIGIYTTPDTTEDSHVSRYITVPSIFARFFAMHVTWLLLAFLLLFLLLLFFFLFFYWAFCSTSPIKKIPKVA